MSDGMLQAEQLVRAGQPRAALAQLTQVVRTRPGDAKLRVFLAQLLCLLGDWSRAHAQLNTAADLDASNATMREMYGYALRCEMIRASVFAGTSTPMVFGEPEQWLALLIESLLHHQPQEQDQADRLAALAFEAAPASRGSIDDRDFSWIADADSRLGPVLEAMIDGRYYWIPFDRLKAIRFEEPQDLRDMVWLPAYLSFENGGESVALIPTRYPGSERESDEALVMGRLTQWTQAGPDRWQGKGQRVLVTDLGEHDLLSIRHIQLSSHG